MYMLYISISHHSYILDLNDLKTIAYKKEQTVKILNFWFHLFDSGNSVTYNNHADEATIWTSSCWRYQRSHLGAWPLNLCWFLKTESVKRKPLLPYMITQVILHAKGEAAIWSILITWNCFFKQSTPRRVGILQLTDSFGGPMIRIETRIIPASLSRMISCWRFKPEYQHSARQLHGSHTLYRDRMQLQSISTLGDSFWRWD